MKMNKVILQMKILLKFCFIYYLPRNSIYNEIKFYVCKYNYIIIIYNYK